MIWVNTFKCPEELVSVDYVKSMLKNYSTKPPRPYKVIELRVTASMCNANDFVKGMYTFLVEMLSYKAPRIAMKRKADKKRKLTRYLNYKRRKLYNNG